MKHLFTVLLAALILAGCSKQINVNGPETQPKREFLKLNLQPTEKVENYFLAGDIINGSQGGEIELEKSFYSNGKQGKVEVKLTIPAGAFTGTKLIAYLINSDNGTINFYPSMTFNKSLTLDYKIKGINLSGYNPADIDFGYMNGSTIVIASYDSKKINIGQGLLEVDGARITHFSRYGWATIDDPGE